MVPNGLPDELREIANALEAQAGSVFEEELQALRLWADRLENPKPPRWV
jgi:hypothetical protein